MMVISQTIPRRWHLLWWSEKLRDTHQRITLFFSSRRRHTRWNCDWSSDVCSSDLKPRIHGKMQQGHEWLVEHAFLSEGHQQYIFPTGRIGRDVFIAAEFDISADETYLSCKEIGRASCREGVYVWTGSARSRSWRTP